MSCDSPLEEAYLLQGFCASEIHVLVDQARSILAVGTSDSLILERGKSRVIMVKDTNGDALPDSVIEIASASELNHGLGIHGEYLYASSATTVYRWPFALGQDTGPLNEEDATQVIQNMNADGNGGAPFGHLTRTLAFDSEGRLYVSIGSAENVDPNSFRARIRRFDVNAASLPIDFVNGEVFADGLRNEVGLAFDRHGVLWGVENGADKLYRKDLGGDIHNNNPAEELNRFPDAKAGQHWGYPYCWTEYNLPASYGGGRGTVWAWPSFMDTGTTDEWCRSTTNGPEVAMQAHSAPLGVTFYNWTDSRDLGCLGSFPKEVDGYAFIAFHGSWNRDEPTGYKVVFVPMNHSGHATGDPVDLLAPMSPLLQWPDGFRPVDVDFDLCGRLLVSSDGTQADDGQFYGSKIVRISYLAGASRNSSSSAVKVAPASISAANSAVHHPLLKVLSTLLAFCWVMRLHRY